MAYWRGGDQLRWDVTQVETTTSGYSSVHVAMAASKWRRLANELILSPSEHSFTSSHQKNRHIPSFTLSSLSHQPQIRHNVKNVFADPHCITLQHPQPLPHPRISCGGETNGRRVEMLVALTTSARAPQPAIMSVCLSVARGSRPLYLAAVARSTLSIPDD